MKKKAGKIKFDMDSTADISDELIEINHDFYTKPVRPSVSGSFRFPIPTPIKAELDLKPGMLCYFVQYSEGFYISFGVKPNCSEKQMKFRKISYAGCQQTLFLLIPQFIQRQFPEMKFVQLIRTPGFQPYEWQIQFHSTEYDLTTDFENF